MADKQYQEDLRRIVGVDNLQSGLGAQPSKAQVKGRRGVAYFQKDGSLGSTSGETPSGGSGTGATQPGDAYDGSNDSTGVSYPGGGGGEDANGTSTTNPDPAESENLIDSSNLFGGALTVGGSLDGILNLKDCTTNQNLDVYYTDPPTPDGWDDPDDLPVLGFPDGASFCNSGCPSIAAHGEYTDIVYNPGTSKLWTIGYYWDGANNVIAPEYTPPGGWSIGNWCSSCPTGDGRWPVWLRSSNNFASSPTYSPDGWPDDNKTTLIYNPDSELYETHPNDLDAAPEYQDGVSNLSLCTQSGDPVLIEKSVDGGTVISSVNDNLFLVRGLDGKITAAGSNSAKDQYVAK